ncbi:MAG: flagellar protein FlgN [Peptococcaceae bacterium]|jgi:flagellar biosynthesis/type III secretory pathway chaperone|nr:flagellar protein FlgN [Peptococcaceae bacterium]
MITEMIPELNEILCRQVERYCELKILAENKQRALINNDIATLAECVAQEEQFILEAGALERERISCVKRYIDSHSENPEGLTLAELTQQYPELVELHQELKSVLEELQIMHESNKMLLNQALKLMNYTMSLFTQPDDHIYGRPGAKERNTAKLKLVDKKI